MIIMCTVLNFCDHQELDRQVPLMDEMDDKVGSLATIILCSFFCQLSQQCLNSDKMMDAG
jgi:hypothetical protein